MEQPNAQTHFAGKRPNFAQRNPHPDAELFALVKKCEAAKQRYDAAGVAFDEAEQRYVDIKPPQALIKTEEDARMRLFVRGGAGSSYDRAEIAVIGAICRSMSFPQDSYPIYRRCRNIIDSWGECTAQKEAEGARSGYVAADRVQTGALDDLNSAADQLAMTPALTVDGVLAKARVFKEISGGYNLAEAIKEGIRETSALEIEPLAISLESDLFLLAKAPLLTEQRATDRVGVRA